MGVLCWCWGVVFFGPTPGRGRLSMVQQGLDASGRRNRSSGISFCKRGYGCRVRTSYVFILGRLMRKVVPSAGVLWRR